MNCFRILRNLDLFNLFFDDWYWKENEFTSQTSKLFVSGAAKNIFGVIPGLEKPTYHARLQDPHSFAQMLVDLNEVVKPKLQIMDAAIGMEGDSPFAKMIALAFEYTLQPVIHEDLCVSCFKCVHSCPVKTISLVDNRPVVDYTKCIRCYCCHEMCDSKAISLERNETAGHELARLTGTNRNDWAVFEIEFNFKMCNKGASFCYMEASFITQSSGWPPQPVDVPKK